MKCMFLVGENRRVCGEHGTLALHRVYGRVRPSPALHMLGTDELGLRSLSHTISWMSISQVLSFSLSRATPSREGQTTYVQFLETGPGESACTETIQFLAKFRKKVLIF